jgi:hypothetical protein
MLGGANQTVCYVPTGEHSEQTAHQRCKRLSSLFGLKQVTYTDEIQGREPQQLLASFKNFIFDGKDPFIDTANRTLENSELLEGINRMAYGNSHGVVVAIEGAVPLMGESLDTYIQYLAQTGYIYSRTIKRIFPLGRLQSAVPLVGELEKTRLIETRAHLALGRNGAIHVDYNISAYRSCGEVLEVKPRMVVPYQGNMGGAFQ